MSNYTVDKVMVIVNLIQRDTIRVNDCNYYYFEYLEVDKEILKAIDTMPYLVKVDHEEQKGYLEYKNIEEIKNTFYEVQTIVSDAIKELDNDDVMDSTGGFDTSYLVDIISEEIDSSSLSKVYRELAKVIVNTLDLDDIIDIINRKIDDVKDAVNEVSNTIDSEADNILAEI